eukprot:1535935-Alexandrium_andersonii.AAC.1
MGERSLAGDLGLNAPCRYVKASLDHSTALIRGRLREGTDRPLRRGRALPLGHRQAARVTTYPGWR